MLLFFSLQERGRIMSLADGRWRPEIDFAR